MTEQNDAGRLLEMGDLILRAARAMVGDGGDAEPARQAEVRARIREGRVGERLVDHLERRRSTSLSSLTIETLLLTGDPTAYGFLVETYITTANNQTMASVDGAIMSGYNYDREALSAAALTAFRREMAVDPPDVGRQRRIVALCGLIGGSYVVEALAGELLDQNERAREGDDGAGVRSALIDALSRQSSPDVIPVLSTCLTDPDPTVAHNAVAGLCMAMARMVDWTASEAADAP